ncbi:hypothetical protein [Enterococcus sp. AZ050]|uniref:AbiU2 domain-containing protein n=1 Tax=Enterococcus sp. AZ050 TaxID=2774696 RepID=UPI003F2893A3
MAKQEKETIMTQLDFLWNSSIEMNSYFTVIKQIDDNFYTYKDQILLSPTFYLYTYNALIIATCSEVSRMYDRRSKNNLFKFLNYCIQNSELLFLIHKNDGSGLKSKLEIDEFMHETNNKIKKIELVLDNLKKQRDKIYSHNDFQKKEDKNLYINNNPIFVEDMEKLIQIATEFLQSMYVLLINRKKAIVANGILDWENTLQILKDRGIY